MQVFAEGRWESSAGLEKEESAMYDRSWEVPTSVDTVTVSMQEHPIVKWLGQYNLHYTALPNGDTWHRLETFFTCRQRWASCPEVDQVLKRK